jgi:hypothetical protein
MFLTKKIEFLMVSPVVFLSCGAKSSAVGTRDGSLFVSIATPEKNSWTVKIVTSGKCSRVCSGVSKLEKKIPRGSFEKK